MFDKFDALCCLNLIMSRIGGLAVLWFDSFGDLFSDCVV